MSGPYGRTLRALAGRCRSSTSHGLGCPGHGGDGYQTKTVRTILVVGVVALAACNQQTGPDTVVADYALSEQFVDYVEEFRGGADEESAETGAYAFLSKLPLEILTPLMRSDPRYLETTLAWMDEEYGSVMDFIREELDVTSAELSAIRAQLLE